MQTYGRLPFIADWGEGCILYDHNGKKYLDLIGGIATCSVGHGNKAVADAVAVQSKKLICASNLLYTSAQVQLAQKLDEISGLQRTFFCNSGAEANEAAIKLAKKVTKKKQFIAFEHSFHGRTTGSLAATWKQEYKEKFTPLMPQVVFAKFGDMESVKKVFTSEMAAVLVEPIQGEAGAMTPPKGFLSQLLDLCHKNNGLLIVDEVQTGTARTGKFFAYQHENILPDIVTTAKGLANGVPIGVCLSNLDFERKDHASTFGGNSLSCAAALATIEYIENNNLLHNAEERGKQMMTLLQRTNEKYKCIKEIRGMGLLIGVEFHQAYAKTIVEKCLEQGLLTNNTDERTLRFLPPLIITKEQIEEAIAILEKVVATLEREK